MLLRLPWPWVVVLDAVAWTLWSAAAGWWMALDGRRAPAAPRWTDRSCASGPFERGGRWYERTLRVKRWKSWLPEARPGLRRTLQAPPAAGGTPGPCRRFLTDCRRAERTHWLIVAATPVFAVWNPLGLFLAMVAFAVVANGPCLVVLRYNRARLLARQPPAA